MLGLGEVFFVFFWGFLGGLGAFFFGGVVLFFFFFLKQSYDSSQKSLDNIHLAILHLFFTSCWYFRIILNTGNSSKCLGSLLKVQLASIPQVIPLESFPTSQEHPLKTPKPETSIPTQSPSSGDLCLSSSEGRSPNIPNTQ